MSFHDLKTGDRVHRMIGGTLPMLMEVVSNDGKVIICGAVEADGSLTALGWEFDVVTGGEIDESLGWDPPRTPTGSILQRIGPVS